MKIHKDNLKDTFKYDVFISHSSEASLTFVEKLAEWFEKEGVTCWYAPRNLDNTGAGKDYDDEIVCAIQDSHCMVVVLNDSALKAKWVKNEVAYAEDRHKMIFPFAVMELSVDNGLLLRLKTRHIIAAYPEPEKKFPLLLKNVKQTLGQDVSGITIIEEKSTSQWKPKHEFDIDYEEGNAFLEANQEEDAFLAFFKSAKKGNEKAKEKLVEIARNNSKDALFLDDHTWEQIEELSDQGEGYADLLMHFKYYSKGTQNEVAFAYLLRSIEKYESPIAYLQMGICYGWGLGVQISDVLSKRYFEIAGEKGCGTACSYLGQLYMYGGERIEKDLAKAKEYLQKGVAMKDARSFQTLSNFYTQIKEDEKVRELAQQMIDKGVKGGYSLMGDYYYDNDKKQQAEEWFQQATKHKEARAWGRLALIYWNKNENEKAYRFAQNGLRQNDSFSFFMLGYMCEQDGDITKAWEYYHQVYLRFGTCAENIGRLYLEENYLPDNYKPSDLKRELELEARHSDAESSRCMIKLILREQGGHGDEVSYERIKDIPESYEYVLLGAKAGDEELMFIYGRLLIESEGEMYNPFVGIDYVESAAGKNNMEAAEYAFKYYLNNPDPKKLSQMSQYMVDCNSYVGKNTRIVIDNYFGERNGSFVKWLYRSLRLLVYEDTEMFYDCFQVFQQAVESSKEKLEDWANKCFDELSKEFAAPDGTPDIFTPFYAYFFALKLSIEKDKENDTIVSFVRGVLDIEYDIEHMSRMHYFKDMVHLIWPDYSEEKILNGDFSNKRDLRIFYGVNNNTLPDLLLGDYILLEVNDYVLLKPEGISMLPNGLITTKTRDFIHAYLDLLASYRNMVEAGMVEESEDSCFFDWTEDDVCCSEKDVLQYCLNSLKMLISSRNIYGEKWKEIVENLNDASRFPNIAETIEDENARALLCDYHDIVVERDKLLMFDIQMNYHGSELRSYVADIINAILDELDENNVKHEVARVTKDTLPESIEDMVCSIVEFYETFRKGIKYFEY